MRALDQVDDLETAKEIARLALAENARLSKRLAEVTRQLAVAQGKAEGEQLEIELTQLREQLARFQDKLFGDSSEKRPRTEKPVPEPKPKRGHGPREQPDLEHREVLFELDEDKRACPACGEALQAIPGLTEDSEIITSLRQTCFAVLAQRQKYRCRCNGAIVTAPGPRKPIPGGRYDLRFAAQVATDKYCDHLPLERQARILSRQGLQVESQTLWDQIEALARHLQPTYEALREYILGADVIGADETWWRLMTGKSSKRWWAWGLTTHDACWYKVTDSRSGATARDVLRGFEGTVLCDGYKAYETVASECTGIRLSHCWAHARRNFVEAEPNYPKACAEALDMIGKLFEVESGLPNSDGLEGEEKLAALELRQKQRDEKSRPLVRQLRDWALTQKGLPKSGLRKSVDYLLTYWQGLTAFLDDPHVEIHNNRTERALRGMVLGRKNHFGSRSKRGTEVAALFYSLVETAKLCGLDPARYLLVAAGRAIDDPGSVTLPHELAAG